jgi:hypothetical protein
MRAAATSAELEESEAQLDAGHTIAADAVRQVLRDTIERLNSETPTRL